MLPPYRARHHFCYIFNFCPCEGGHRANDNGEDSHPVLVSFDVLADLVRRVRNGCNDRRNHIHGEVKDAERGEIILGVARSDY